MSRSGRKPKFLSDKSIATALWETRNMRVLLMTILCTHDGDIRYYSQEVGVNCFLMAFVVAAGRSILKGENGVQTAIQFDS
jgi:hypothetical protein